MNPRKSTLLKLAIAVFLSAFLLACVSKINQENYAKIQNGMTMEEVKAILGEPTTSSTSGIGPLSGTSAIWKSRDGTSISINFVNSKVLLKSFAEKK
jgi:hypothetical protein